MNNEDTEHAQLAQQELDERRLREDNLLRRLRNECSGFRKDNDDFYAETQELNTLIQEHVYAEYQRFVFREPRSK